jgi:hypothetical protein
VSAYDPNPPSGEPIAAEHEAGSTLPADIALDFLNRLRPTGPWQLSAINPNVNNDIKTVTATRPLKGAAHRGRERGLTFAFGIGSIRSTLD